MSGVNEVYEYRDRTRPIIKILNQIQGRRGHPQYQIFDDYLDICYTVLRMLPTHAISYLETGQMAEDDEEGKKIWAGLRERYDKHGFDLLTQAFTALLETHYDAHGRVVYGDVIGSIYMQWGWPNKNKGQYFTPWPVAEMMGRVLGHDNEPEIEEQVRDLSSSDPLLAIGFSILKTLGRDGNFSLLPDFVINMIPTIVEKFEPVKFCEPCCGSGVMILGYAAAAPQWMNRLGLIQYYGQDIDETCVKMCNINMMLHLLNGYGLRMMGAGTLLLHALARKPIPMTPDNVPATQAPTESVIQEQPSKIRIATAEQVDLFGSMDRRAA